MPSGNNAVLSLPLPFVWFSFSQGTAAPNRTALVTRYWQLFSNLFTPLAVFSLFTHIPFVTISISPSSSTATVLGGHYAVHATFFHWRH